jgi:hypothetical protein
MTAMTSLRENSRHHHKIFSSGKTGDIASLLALPNMDAHKLWMLTAHTKPAVIQEVGVKKARYYQSTDISFFGGYDIIYRETHQ